MPLYMTTKGRAGTELTAVELASHVSQDLLAQVEIHVSRPIPRQSALPLALWLHDPALPEFTQETFEPYSKIIFVSYWQREHYMALFNIPYSRTIVLKNAVEMIPQVTTSLVSREANDTKPRLIYTSAPHKGLAILAEALRNLPDLDISVEIYTGFELYGKPEDNKPFERTFSELRADPRVVLSPPRDWTYIQFALAEASLFVLPSTFPETFCRSLVEAMVAGLPCLHSDLGALPEISGGLTQSYPYHEDPIEHVKIFHSALEHALSNLPTLSSLAKKYNRDYAIWQYSWQSRKPEWESFLASLAEAQQA